MGPAAPGLLHTPTALSLTTRSAGHGTGAPFGPTDGASDDFFADVVVNIVVKCG